VVEVVSPEDEPVFNCLFKLWRLAKILNKSIWEVLVKVRADSGTVILLDEPPTAGVFVVGSAADDNDDVVVVVVVVDCGCCCCATSVEN
jgi:hypothetical protein